MSLVPMKDILLRAEAGGYGVGAFSVADMEMILGAVKAAEELQVPMILQIAQVRLPFSPLDKIAPMMIAAAKNASIPVAVHFDHGLDVQAIGQALDLGFTSVMIDASKLSIDENIKITSEVRKMADRYNASVEAEVGQLGVSEDGTGDASRIHSDPKEVKRLYEETGVDAIALSIGNQHGFYKAAPKLNFEILEEANSLVPVPLVLHGGSGISDEDFRKCISLGITKINVATATFSAVKDAAKTYLEGEKTDYFSLSDSMMKGAYKNIKRHMQVFSMKKEI
ncbi:MAG: class II aldolase [Lachnospiraceae bacterium]|nr:class II aldolase [Lachnospiraceae bacterium]